MNIKFSEEIKTILPLMIEVQEKLPQFQKDADNPHASSKYVTLDNILGKLNPILNERGILLTQIPVENNTEDEHGIGVETIFIHKDGEYISYPPVFYQFEKGGRMNLTQSVGSIISYARRYALTSILGISTGDDTDGNQNNNQNNNQSNNYNNRNNNQNQSQQNNQPDAFSDNVSKIVDRVEKLAKASGQTSQDVNKAMLERTNKETGNTDGKITKDNIAEYNKQLRLAETKFKKAKTQQNKQNQNEQTSLMDGNTTTAVNWGQK